MQDFGGAESFVPSENVGAASEGLSEEARARFQAQAAAAAQVRKEEQKSKKRDDGVAQAILAFLTDTQRKHLASAIAMVVARDCPSPFILSLLSLINDDCRNRTLEYIKESVPDTALQAERADAAKEMAMWTERMSKVLATDTTHTVRAFLVEGGQLDISLLNLASAIVQEFAVQQGNALARPAAEQAVNRVLAQVFGPHMSAGSIDADAAA